MTSSPPAITWAIGQHQPAGAVHNDAGAEADAFLPAGPQGRSKGIFPEAEELFKRRESLSFDDMGAGDIDDGGSRGIDCPNYGRQARTVGRGGGNAACGQQQGAGQARKQGGKGRMKVSSGVEYGAFLPLKRTEFQAENALVLFIVVSFARACKSVCTFKKVKREAGGTAAARPEASEKNAFFAKR